MGVPRDTHTHRIAIRTQSLERCRTTHLTSVLSIESAGVSFMCGQRREGERISRSTIRGKYVLVYKGVNMFIPSAWQTIRPTRKHTNIYSRKRREDNGTRTRTFPGSIIIVRTYVNALNSAP